MHLEIDISDLSKEDKDALFRATDIIAKKGYKLAPIDALVLENEISVRDVPTEGITKWGNFNMFEFEDVNTEKRKEIFKDITEEYEDYSWIFKDEFSHLRSLYKEVSDPQSNVMEEVKFEIVAQVKIDEVDEYKGFSFPVYKGNWKSDGEAEITEKDAAHQLLDRLAFPDLILPTRPCKLTSKQTYDIIRKHVVENIDGKYAKVTSDYDFCFTVKKVIPLAEQVEYTVDVNAFYPRRKPKYQKRYQDTREVEIFEMTSAEHKYKGYTVIEPFVGNNEEELGENIRKYLKGLMDYINEPLKECKHCNGKGVILDLGYITTEGNKSTTQWLKIIGFARPYLTIG